MVQAYVIVAQVLVQVASREVVVMSQVNSPGLAITIVGRLVSESTTTSSEAEHPVAVLVITKVYVHHALTSG